MFRVYFYMDYFVLFLVQCRLAAYYYYCNIAIQFCVLDITLLHCTENLVALVLSMTALVIDCVECIFFN